MTTNSSGDEQLFADTLIRPEHERATFAERACGASVALKERILGLLKMHELTESLIRGFAPSRELLLRLPPQPSPNHHIEEMLADGDTVITQLRITGTHRGPFMDHPATGRQFDVRICHVDHWQDGKIKRAWYYWDTGTFLRQLGIHPHKNDSIS